MVFFRAFLHCNAHLEIIYRELLSLIAQFAMFDPILVFVAKAPPPLVESLVFGRIPALFASEKAPWISGKY